MRSQARKLHRLDALSLSHRTLTQTPRFVHSSARRHVSAAPVPSNSTPQLLPSASPQNSTPSRHESSFSTLSRLPMSSVLRSYLIMRMSSSPALLSLCFNVLRRMLDSKTYIMSIERNPLLAKLLKSTFYAQFCAGESPKEVQTNTTIAREALGYDAIMLEFALEVLGGGAASTAEETSREIATWKKGMLDSIGVAQEGDFVGLKWSGLGRHALHLLQNGQPPTPEMCSAITAACDAAAAKNIALLPGAEEEITNHGLESWNLEFQKKYNTPERGRAIIYTTYQCYLKSIPSRIAQHLVTAQKEGYIAGIKLVRGAYLASEPRHLVWESKEGTDACYDSCTEAILKQQWTPTFPAPPGHTSTPFPRLDVFLATHNAASIAKAQAIRIAQLATSLPDSLPRLTYAQLWGMADEISQQLVQDENQKKDTQARVAKCMTWGTTTECLNFLLRRASENKEAAMRTEDTRRAMGREIVRRLRGFLGMM
ncbi:proline oxidase-like protein [Lojkania enalia]|uniref:Proline dehydrogenase n=1 Tax=Lojkania enalia TaxID=147567 RepID=A0A9P4K3G1_9PLEO|nr:proline oxidase-like protein [Didymosphaeria enalia]